MPKTLMGLASLGRPRTYTEPLLKSWTRPSGFRRAVACSFLWNFLVRSCLGAGDPDNGGVLAIEGLESSVGGL
jgi:hypothetical protein